MKKRVVVGIEDRSRMISAVSRCLTAGARAGCLSVVAVAVGLGSVGVAAPPPVPVTKPLAPSRVRVTVGARALHRIDPRVFGIMQERADYMGEEIGAEWAWDPARGDWRPGFLRYWQDLRATVLRFPGGLRADEYDWRWGIENVPGRGPRAQQAYRSEGRPITHFVGTDETLRMCERTGAIPLLVVNIMQFGQDPEAGARLAADWVEYCNSPNNGRNPNGGVDWAAVRAKNGRARPYSVRLWELGNEIWLSGRFDADLYGRMLPGYVRAMRAVDPNLEFIADGQTRELREAVARHAGKLVQHLALHIYQPWRANGAGLTPEEGWYGLMSVPTPAFDADIESLARFNRESGHGYKIALTEWNANGWWDEHWPLHTDYPYAVIAASMYHGLMRHADDISLACLSMLIGRHWAVNVLRVDPEGRHPIYPTPTYDVARLYNRWHGREFVESRAEGGATFATHRAFGQSPPRSGIPVTDVAVTRSARTLYVHIVNRHATAPAPMVVDLSAQPAFRRAAGELVWTAGPSVSARNDFGRPDAFPLQRVAVRASWPETRVEIPPRSACVLVLRR
jgi:alpha-L-arabinofuranosidase